MAEKKDGEDSEKVRKRFGESSEKTQMNELTDTQKKIVELLCYDKQLSAKKIAEKLGLGSRSIEKNIKKLKTLGFLIRHGSPKSGYWEVTDCIAKNDDRAMSYYMEIVEDKAESGFEVSYLDLHGTTPPKKFYHKI